jgi:predicted nucleic acid-binding protein
MKTRIVIDTNCLIFYFSQLFLQPNRRQHRFSATTLNLLDQAFGGAPDVLLSIPSIVFVEIFDKWLTNEEFAKKFYYEVYLRVRESQNIEVRGIDAEVIECAIQIGDIMASHDMHDKIILASAIILDCPLVTTDETIIEYVKKFNVIPRILS